MMIDAKADIPCYHQLNDDAFSAVIAPAEVYDLTSLIKTPTPTMFDGQSAVVTEITWCVYPFKT
jgi:hypothetical protein